MLSKIINDIHAISNRSLEAIEKLAEIETWAKKEIFIEKDKPNQKEYFVLEGIVRSFVLNPNGEEISISFFGPQSVISPFVSRTKNGKSQFSFQALSNTKLAVMDAKAFENLRLNNIELRNFAFLVLQNELLRKVDKEIGLASLKAKDRLIKFRNEFPQLESLIPHPHIASYLGITNISLSRLRREIRD